MITVVNLKRPGPGEISIYKETDNTLSLGDGESSIVIKPDYVFLDGSLEEVVLGISKELYTVFSPKNYCVVRDPTGEQLAMFGTEGNQGIVGLIGDFLFSCNSARSFSFYCSFCCIVNGTIVDLLLEGERLRISVLEALDGTIIAENLSQYLIQGTNELDFLIERGLQKKESLSGDYHTVLQIVLETSKMNAASISKKAKLNFCDLGPDKSSFLTVISGLKSETNVNYKESVLAHFLKDTLSCNSKLIYFASVTSTPAAKESLKLAGQVREIKVKLPKPKTNQFSNTRTTVTITELEKLIQENRQLRTKHQNLTGHSLNQHTPTKDIGFPTNCITHILHEGTLRLTQQLASQNRCHKCTLILPCAHYSETSELPVQPPLAPTGFPFKLRSKRLKMKPDPVKSSILEYKNKKILQEIATIQAQQREKTQQLLYEKHKGNKRKQYFSKQRQKIEEFRVAKSNREQKTQIIGSRSSCPAHKRYSKAKPTRFGDRMIHQLVNESISQLQWASRVPSRVSPSHRRDSLCFLEQR